MVKLLHNLEYYKRVKYKRTVEMEQGEDEWAEYFVARIPLLEECMAVGHTRQDALFNLDQAFDAYIEDALENGDNIPEPILVKKSPVAKLVKKRKKGSLGLPQNEINNNSISKNNQLTQETYRQKLSKRYQRDLEKKIAANTTDPATRKFESVPLEA